MSKLNLLLKSYLFIRLLSHRKMVPVTLLILLFLVIPTIVNAQISLSIFPEKFDLELSPGEVYQDKIRISNLSQSELPIDIQIKNFLAAGEKGEMKFNEEERDISFDPRQWIKFEKKQFVLGANESKELNFRIEVPQTAEPGGHYAVAFFQTELSLSARGGGARIIPTLGALFLLKVAGAEEKYPSLDRQIELVELNAPSFIEFGPLDISFRLKNNNPVHVRAGGQIIIYDIFGKKKEEIKIDDQTILPDKIRFFEIKTGDKKLFDKFFIGPYRVELVLSTQTWREKIGNNQQLKAEISFWGFPWKIFLVILAVVLFIIFICLIKKERQTKSFTK